LNSFTYRWVVIIINHFVLVLELWGCHLTFILIFHDHHRIVIYRLLWVRICWLIHLPILGNIQTWMDLKFIGSWHRNNVLQRSNFRVGVFSIERPLRLIGSSWHIDRRWSLALSKSFLIFKHTLIAGHLNILGKILVLSHIGCLLLWMTLVYLHAIDGFESIRWGADSLDRLDFSKSSSLNISAPHTGVARYVIVIKILLILIFSALKSCHLLLLVCHWIRLISVCFWKLICFLMIYQTSNCVLI